MRRGREALLPTGDDAIGPREDRPSGGRGREGATSTEDIFDYRGQLM